MKNDAESIRQWLKNERFASQFFGDDSCWRENILLEAIRERSFDVIKALLEAGINIDASVLRNESLLYLVRSHAINLAEAIELIKIFLGRGIDIVSGVKNETTLSKLKQKAQDDIQQHLVTLKSQLPSEAFSLPVGSFYHILFFRDLAKCFQTLYRCLLNPGKLIKVTVDKKLRENRN